MRSQSAFYWKELLSPPAVLGVVAILVQPVLLAIRATDLEHALTMASIVDRSIGTFTGFGFRYPIGTCFVTSAALTLAQMVCASLYFVEMPEGAKRRCLRIFSAVAWVLLSLLELAGSIFCSRGSAGMIVTGFAIAALLAICESACGILILDCFLVPAILAPAWTVYDLLKRVFRVQRNATRLTGPRPAGRRHDAIYSSHERAHLRNYGRSAGAGCARSSAVPAWRKGRSRRPVPRNVAV